MNKSELVHHFGKTTFFKSSRVSVVRSIPVEAPDSFKKLSESNEGFIANTRSNRSLRA